MHPNSPPHVLQVFLVPLFLVIRGGSPLARGLLHQTIEKRHINWFSKLLVWFVQKMFLCIIAFLLLFVGTIIFHTSGRLRFIQIVFGNQLCTCILWFTQGQSAFETNCCRETTALAWFTQVQSAFQTNCLRESTVHLLFLIKRANN